MSKGQYTYNDLSWVKAVGLAIDQARQKAPQYIREKKPLWEEECPQWIDDFEHIFAQAIRAAFPGRTAAQLWELMSAKADPGSMEFVFWQAAILTKAFPDEYWGWSCMMRNATQYVLEVALPSWDGFVVARRYIDFVAGCDAEAFDKVFAVYLAQDETAPWYVTGLWYDDKGRRIDKFDALKDFVGEIDIGKVPQGGAL